LINQPTQSKILYFLTPTNNTSEIGSPIRHKTFFYACRLFPIFTPCMGLLSIRSCYGA